MNNWKIGWSPPTIVYVKPFLTVDLSIDKDYSDLLNYSLKAGLIPELLNECANHMLPKSGLTITKLKLCNYIVI